MKIRRDNSLQLTLTELHVPDSLLDVVVDGVSGVDHESIDELHGLGMLTAELARDDNLRYKIMNATCLCHSSELFIFQLDARYRILLVNGARERTT